MMFLPTGSLVALACSLAVQASPVSFIGERGLNTTKIQLDKYEQELFDYSMLLNDLSWDPTVQWVASDDDYGHWDERFTIWYVPGLLHRAQGNDVENAKAAIRNVISTQFVNDTFAEAWYGTFNQGPDMPAPGVNWDPSIYGSYDPNWAYFTGVTLVQIVEEFSHLLDDGLIGEIETACYRASRMLMNRNGYNGDNLVTAYTNPALARAVLVSWTGARINDANLTQAGAQYADDIYNLFTANDFNTFGEYNVPTYYGEDVALLCQWIKHAPANTTLPEKATYMLTKMWEDIAEHYNYNLKNMVGPYDRVYHRNMLIDDSIITLWFWMLLGREKAPVASLGQASTMYDATQGASFALLGPTFRSVISKDSAIAKALVTPVSEDRLFTKGIRVSLDNDTTRINTAWVSPNLMMGGQQLDEEVSRGSQFTPFIAHYKSGETFSTERPSVSFFQLFTNGFPTTLNVTVTPNHATIIYPNTTQKGADTMEFVFGDLPISYWNSGNVFDGFNNLPCLNVTVSAPGFNVSVGQYNDFSIQSNTMFPVTYTVQENFTGIPQIDLDVVYTC